MGLLRLHHRLASSRANGPGLRAVLWFQGCSLGCPGCFNPETHAFEGGERLHPDEAFEWLRGLPDIQGVTFSGGEPLQQPQPLLALLQRLRRDTHLSTLLFTGFRWEEIRHHEILKNLDVVLAGRFQAEHRVARGLLGSSNKTVHFLTDRYGPADLAELPEAEVVIDAEGNLVFTGIDPLEAARGL
ncbi:MAG: 4Fe-4S single cluster domain-containing protein [Candidatus Eremiobacterota bacterium]